MECSPFVSTYTSSNQGSPVSVLQPNQAIHLKYDSTVHVLFGDRPATFHKSFPVITWCHALIRSHSRSSTNHSMELLIVYKALAGIWVCVRLNMCISVSQQSVSGHHSNIRKHHVCTLKITKQAAQHTCAAIAHTLYIEISFMKSD